MHTIKGTCGFLGLPRLESVDHAGENALGLFREGELEVTPEAVSPSLECLDQIRALLIALEETESEPDGEILVPEEDFLADFARDHDKDPDLAALGDDEALRGALLEVVERVNKGLSTLERVRRFTIARAPFTVENQMMTPTLKIRRHAITAAYGAELDGLY